MDLKFILTILANLIGMSLALIPWVIFYGKRLKKTEERMGNCESKTNVNKSQISSLKRKVGLLEVINEKLGKYEFEMFDVQSEFSQYVKETFANEYQHLENIYLYEDGKTSEVFEIYYKEKESEKSE